MPGCGGIESGLRDVLARWECGGCNIKAIYLSALDACTLGGVGIGEEYIFSRSARAGWTSCLVLVSSTRTPIMKSTTIISLVAALAAQQVAGHATFQQLWVDGVDEISSPLPPPIDTQLTPILPGLLRPPSPIQLPRLGRNLQRPPLQCWRRHRRSREVRCHSRLHGDGRDAPAAWGQVVRE